MKMRLIAAAAMCGVAIAIAAASDTSNAPTPQPAAIAALVEQLGSERYAERESASAALEKLGAAAMSALQAAARSENPEVRERASVLVGRLKRTADSSSRVAAKRVKLDYKDLPLGTAVNDLRARTGLPLVLDATRVANPLRKITCETADLPIWEALEVFCQAAGLRELFVNELDVPKPSGRRRGEFVPPPDPRADSVAIVLMDGKPDRLPGDRSTAVRVLALPPNFPGHKVTLGAGDSTLCLDVTPAPGLKWQEVISVKVSRVIDSSDRAGTGGAEKPSGPTVDPNGNVIFVRPGVTMRFDNNGNPIMPETIPNPRVVPVPIKVATATAKSLKRLEGTVFGEMNLINQHLVTIADLKKNTGKLFEGPGDLKVTLLEAKEAARGGQGLVRLQFEYPSPWVVNARRRGFNPNFNPGWPEAPQNPTLARSVQAFDAAGKPFPVASSGTTDMSDDGMTNVQAIQFTFRGEVGLPAKLVVVGPRAVIVEVPFVLENVQLP